MDTFGNFKRCVSFPDGSYALYFDRIRAWFWPDGSVKDAEYVRRNNATVQVAKRHTGVLNRLVRVGKVYIPKAPSPTRPYWERPMAAEGLTSYRYIGEYGWIMVGAKDHADALKVAERATNRPASVNFLQVWDGERYVPVTGSLASWL
jgi:hypothetical protein